MSDRAPGRPRSRHQVVRRQHDRVRRRRHGPQHAAARRRRSASASRSRRPRAGTRAPAHPRPPSRLSRKISTLAIRSSWSTRQSRTRAQAASPGSRLSQRTRPPSFARRLGQLHLVAAPPEHSAASSPAGPAPTTSTVRFRFLAARMRSGCQPRRHSSPIVGFCVQRIGDMVKSPDTQMLQPMHSRMSSMRPSSIFFGQERVGDRGPRGADQVEDAAPTMRTIVSGEVKRPTPTTGLVVSCLMPLIYCSW